MECGGEVGVCMWIDWECGRESRCGMGMGARGVRGGVRKQCTIVMGGEETCRVWRRRRRRRERR